MVCSFSIQYYKIIGLECNYFKLFNLVRNSIPGLSKIHWSFIYREGDPKNQERGLLPGFGSHVGTALKFIRFEV